MYVEHPYKFNDKFYAKVDGKFYEITREVPLYITKRFPLTVMKFTEVKSGSRKTRKP